MTRLCNNQLCVGIVGLGLIGGSLAKAIKEKLNCKVIGYDISADVIDSAKKDGVIDGFVVDGNFKSCDIVFIGLYPKATVDFINNSSNLFADNTIIVDVCGIKRYVCDELEEISKNRNIQFVGAHPMAGREFSGYNNSISTLFDNASVLLTPIKTTLVKSVEFISSFFKDIGFSNVRITTSKNHDKIIAYTSQLAHIVSSSYVKSPTAKEYLGFSAGSFKDLTRVAKLNSKMWTELFMLNSDNLINEIDNIIGELTKYREALSSKDEINLNKLLQKGTDIKDEMNSAEKY